MQTLDNEINITSEQFLSAYYMSGIFTSLAYDSPSFETGVLDPRCVNVGTEAQTPETQIQVCLTLQAMI